MEARAPLPGYATEFKCTAWVKLQVFVLEVATSGPNLIFL